MTTRLMPRVLCDLIRRPAFKVRCKMRVPDKWLDYSKIGEQIPDLPFICFKTPLSESYSYSVNNRYGLTEDEEFTPSQLCHTLEERGIQLGLVIDLTNTYRYYDGKKELEEGLGIKYVKIKFDAYSPECFTPVFDIFARSVKNFLKRAKPDEVIGVHCTHGIHRTGYMICRYLVEEHDFDIERAISLFNQARGHDIEKYIDKLREISIARSALGDRPSTTKGRPARIKYETSGTGTKCQRKRTNSDFDDGNSTENATIKISALHSEVSVNEKPQTIVHVKRAGNPRENHFADGSINESKSFNFDNNSRSLNTTERTCPL